MVHGGTAVSARRQLLSLSLRILLYDNVHASGICAKEEQLHCRRVVCVPNPRSADLCGGGRPRGGCVICDAAVPNPLGLGGVGRPTC